MEHPVCRNVVGLAEETPKTQSGLANIADLRSCESDLNLTEGVKTAGMDILSAACGLIVKILKQIEEGRGALSLKLSSLAGVLCRDRAKGRR